MDVEISIHNPQYDFDDGDPRQLTPAEVHQRALERRPGWLAWELGAPDDEARIADITAVIEADPQLAADLEPRELAGRRYGIVVVDPLRDRLRAALAGRGANLKACP